MAEYYGQQRLGTWGIWMDGGIIVQYYLCFVAGAMFGVAVMCVLQINRK
jgi:hypothetical protein